MAEEERKSVIRMRDAVAALHIHSYGADSPLVDTDVEQANILCPKCAGAHESRRATLNINFEDERFRCFRCGFHGRQYALISFYTGWPYNEVEQRVKNGELKGAKLNESTEAESSKPQESKHLRLAPLNQRDAVYRALLERLDLTPAHEADLIRRGLTEADIQRIGFKSLPRFIDPSGLPKKLIAAGLDLRGVPGFGVANGRWQMARFPDGGYLIPYCNGDGLIQGLQIRYDHKSDSTPKYGPFTSTGMEAGCPAQNWLAWAGDSVAKTGEPFDVVITEGGLKGYIINARTGVNVLSVVGVGSLSKIPDALESMRCFGLRTAFVAYDMDSMKNPDVEHHLKKLVQRLGTMGINWRILRWDPKMKGLDDYIVGSNIYKIT